MEQAICKRKCAVIVALAIVAALVCGVLCFGGTSAKADGTTPAGRVLYYVDCGNLVTEEGGTTQYAGRQNSTGYISQVKTGFMTSSGLDFGKADGTGLYNAYLDKAFGADSITGKEWGFEDYQYANQWCVCSTSATDSSNPYDGYKMSRHVGEGKDADLNINLVYKFQVDDNTTPLKITIGTRSYSNWDDSNTYPYKINNLEARQITSFKNLDVQYVSTQLWEGETITGVEDNGKYYVTLQISDNTVKTTSYVSWIAVTTLDYMLPTTYTLSQIVEKNSTKIKAFPVNDNSILEVDLNSDQQTAINSAEDFSTVEVTATVDSKELTQTVTVIPENTKYFVNVGGIPGAAYSDKKYNATAGYGYTDGTANSNKTFPGNASYSDQTFDKSCRVDITSINYRFDNLTAGKTYEVVLGVTEYWEKWAKEGRVHDVTVNGGKKVSIAAPTTDSKDTSGVWCGISSDTAYGTADNDGKIVVNIACEKDELVIAYILVVEHTHGTMTKTDAVASTCTTQGNVEYYTCPTCEQNYSDQAATNLLTDVKAPLAAHSMTAHPAVPATCLAAGNVAYWSCSTCSKNYDSADGGNVLESVTAPKLAHEPVKHDAVPHTCTTAGTSEYWTCGNEGDNNKYSDAECTTVVTDADLVDPAAHGHFTHHEATGEATCVSPAGPEYWECDVCHKKYGNAQGTGDEVTITGDLGDHAPVAVAAVAATCTTAGQKAHYKCSVCNKTFEDADCETELTDLTVAALGHDYDYENGVWAWTGVTGATYTVKCKHDESHTDALTATITNAVTKAATVDEEGVRTYTATVTVGDKTYTGTKTEAIAKLDGDTQPETPKKSGCGSSVAADSALVALLALVGAGMAISLRRKHTAK